MIQPREDALKYYFYFIHERMNIFWNRIEGEDTRNCADPILNVNKFTNVYRILDRVSQYLVDEVIYGEGESQKEEDVLTRIIVFKIFNKIETWQYLLSVFGEITYQNFSPEIIASELSLRQKQTAIFSAAYMMTGSHSRYNYLPTKHHKWLQMVKDELIDGEKFDMIMRSKSFEEVYHILRKCSFMGNFIAYQYATDLNYSEVINFDENSFVKAGIGAVRGIKKCFEETGGKTDEEIIEHVADNFDNYQSQYGYNSFKNLPNRKMKLIDFQNCFCETDKYLRVKMPELSEGNKRIKQKYRPSKTPIDFTFPPKWNMYNLKSKDSWKLPSTASTLF